VKKFLPCFFMLTVTIFLVMLHYSAFAEPYISSDYPPTEIIVKEINEELKENTKVFNIVGKYASSENSYVLYVRPLTDNDGNEITSNKTKKYSLRRLDTNIWIFNEERVLQK
jgi:hypothetical protein